MKLHTERWARISPKHSDKTDKEMEGGRKEERIWGRDFQIRGVRRKGGVCVCKFP